jgi:hypothetical protein
MCTSKSDVILSVTKTYPASQTSSLVAGLCHSMLCCKASLFCRHLNNDLTPSWMHKHHRKTSMSRFRSVVPPPVPLFKSATRFRNALAPDFCVNSCSARPVLSSAHQAMNLAMWQFQNGRCSLHWNVSRPAASGIGHVSCLASD